MKTVRDIVAYLGNGGGNEFMDMKASGVLIIAATATGPMVLSNVPGDMQLKFIKLLAKNADFSKCEAIRQH